MTLIPLSVFSDFVVMAKEVPYLDFDREELEAYRKQYSENIYYVSSEKKVEAGSHESRCMLKVWKDLTSSKVKLEDNVRKLSRVALPAAVTIADDNPQRAELLPYIQGCQNAEKKMDRATAELKTALEEIQKLQNFVQVFFESSPRNALKLQGFRKYVGYSAEEKKRLKELEQEEQRNSAEDSKMLKIMQESLNAVKELASQASGSGGSSRSGGGSGNKSRSGSKNSTPIKSPHKRPASEIGGFLLVNCPCRYFLIEYNVILCVE